MVKRKLTSQERLKAGVYLWKQIDDAAAAAQRLLS